MGPFPMGYTSTLGGVWTIVYRLNVLMEWGTTTYKRWFTDNVVTWAMERTRQIALEDQAKALAVSDT